jgi:hypothetical protein
MTCHSDVAVDNGRFAGFFEGRQSHCKAQQRTRMPNTSPCQNKRQTTPPCTLKLRQARMTLYAAQGKFAKRESQCKCWKTGCSMAGVALQPVLWTQQRRTDTSPHIILVSLFCRMHYLSLCLGCVEVRGPLCPCRRPPLPTTSCRPRRPWAGGRGRGSRRADQRGRRPGRRWRGTRSA